MFQSEGEAAGSSSAADNSQDLDESQDNKDDKDVKKKKNRCAMCRKKVGLTGDYCYFNDVLVIWLQSPQHVVDRKLFVFYSFVDSGEKISSLLLRQALNKAAFIFAVTYKYSSRN